MLEVKALCNAAADQNDEPDDKPSSSGQISSTELEEEEDKTKISYDIKAPKARSGGDIGARKKYECEECHKTFVKGQHLRVHIQSTHQGVKYACDHCGKLKQFTHSGSLLKHIKEEHKAVKYACDQCDNQFKRQYNLVNHINAKHKCNEIKRESSDNI